MGMGVFTVGFIRSKLSNYRDDPVKKPKKLEDKNPPSPHFFAPMGVCAKSLLHIYTKTPNPLKNAPGHGHRLYYTVYCNTIFGYTGVRGVKK